MEKKYTIMGASVFIIDALTKWIAHIYLPEKEIILFPGISFELGYNKGLAWGLASGYGYNTTLPIVCVTAFILYKFYKHTSPFYDNVTKMLIIAGGMGNLITRLWAPGVIDFIKLSAYGYTFPLFNIADIAICLGIVGMLHRACK